MDHDNIGVAVVIENSVSKKVLLIEEETSKLGSNKKEGELSLVVGHIKEGESPLEAATREIEEETGIKGLVPDHLVNIFYFRKGHVVFLFSCNIEVEKNSIGNWFSIEEAKKLKNLRSGVIDALIEFEKGNAVSSKLIFVS